MEINLRHNLTIEFLILCAPVRMKDFVTHDCVFSRFSIKIGRRVSSRCVQSNFTRMLNRIEDNNIIPVVRKPDFCICENKDADQLRGSREADQRLCFRYMDSTIPLLP